MLSWYAYISYMHYAKLYVNLILFKSNPISCKKLDKEVMIMYVKIILACYIQSYVRFDSVAKKSCFKKMERQEVRRKGKPYP